jgi:hypothetical protein
MREVDRLPVLRDELAAHKAAARSAEPDELVFTTARGNACDKNTSRAVSWHRS